MTFLLCEIEITIAPVCFATLSAVRHFDCIGVGDFRQLREFCRIHTDDGKAAHAGGDGGGVAVVHVNGDVLVRRTADDFGEQLCGEDDRARRGNDGGQLGLHADFKIVSGQNEAVFFAADEDAFECWNGSFGGNRSL